jgi:hypothetical protein
LARFLEPNLKNDNCGFQVQVVYGINPIKLMQGKKYFVCCVLQVVVNSDLLFLLVL